MSFFPQELLWVGHFLREGPLLWNRINGDIGHLVWINCSNSCCAWMKNRGHSLCLVWYTSWSMGLHLFGTFDLVFSVDLKSSTSEWAWIDSVVYSPSPWGGWGGWTDRDHSIYISTDLFRCLQSESEAVGNYEVWSLSNLMVWRECFFTYQAACLISWGALPSTDSRMKS